MLPKNLTLIALTLILVTLVGCSSTEASTSESVQPAIAPDATGVMVLGDVSDEPAKKIARFQPVADYLAANLSEFGIGVGEVKIAPDMETMAKWLASGEVDLYFDSPYPAMTVSEQSGAQPFLRRWKGGSGEYHTVFFTRAETGLTSLDDMQGKVIAFEEPFSTSGFMLPLAYLTQADLNPVEVEKPDAAVAPDQVGYVFSGDDENTIQWVLSGNILVGATDSQGYIEIPEKTRAQLTILAETEPIARQVAMARSDMDPVLLNAIKTTLLGMHETESGMGTLQAFQTSQFDEFPVGVEAALLRMQEMYKLTQAKQ